MVLRKSDDIFFSVTHCGMGVRRDLCARRAGRPCHNASPTAHADSTESRDLTLAKKLDNGRIEAPTRETPFRRHAGQATLPRQVRLKRVAAAPRRYADTPTRRHADTRRYAHTPIRRYADTFPPRRHAHTPTRFPHGANTLSVKKAIDETIKKMEAPNKSSN